MRFFFCNIILIVFLQFGLVRTCANQEKLILKEAKTVELAKNLNLEVKTIKNRFSALNTIKKNTSVKKSIDFFSEIIDGVVINKDNNSMVLFFKKVLDDIIKNPKHELLKHLISKKYKLKKMLNDNELLVLLNGQKINSIQYNSTQLNSIYFIFSNIYAIKILEDMKKSIGNNKQNLMILQKISDERGVYI
jgi:hypothetical protein